MGEQFAGEQHAIGDSPAFTIAKIYIIDHAGVAILVHQLHVVKAWVNRQVEAVVRIEDVVAQSVAAPVIVIGGGNIQMVDAIA